MAEKKAYMVGNIRLSDLNGFEDTVKQGVRGCFIPYDQNPSLYIGTNKQTGVMTVDMDILIRETKASKTGATHFVKLNVGKANRERFQLSQEALDSLRIVGNLYTRTPGQGTQGVQGQQGTYPAPAPQGGFQTGPGYGHAAPQGGYPAPGYGGAPAPQGGYPGPQGGNGAGW